MNTTYITPSELRRAGLRALARELGPVGMIRFIQQFDCGKGDYAKERDAWLPDDVDTIVKTIEQLKASNQLHPTD